MPEASHVPDSKSTVEDGEPFLLLECEKIMWSDEWITDPCYFCGRRHLHSSEPGHRYAHCGIKTAEAYVTLPGGTKVRTGGYVLRLKT